ncbi:MAG: hypothetical protein ACERKD_12565 [Prolixibacteraceae bacterium]
MKVFIKLLFLFSFTVIFFLRSMAQEKWSSEYAYYATGDHLSYAPDEEGNILPDFSHVGYRYGDVEIPLIENVVEVSPIEGDDAANIQETINSLSAISPDENGFRGAVLLKAGTYQIETQLKIGVSGIVLRGEGQDENGTILIATGKNDRSLIEIGGSASIKVDNSTKITVTEDFVPVGRQYLIVSNTSAYVKGDLIAIYRPGTANWISDIKMDQISGAESTQWTASSYNFYFERTVSKVSGDTLFFRNPIVMALDKKYGGGFVYKCTFDRIENIGIENLCLKSEYASETDEEHSWKAVQFNNVLNGWAQNVTSYYFAYACVSLEREAKMISVLNCSCFEPKSIITGSRRYSFYCEGQLNLFKGCQTTEGRHDFVTGSRVCGPNVFTQCTARSAYNDAGPHHRWAMGTLYDVIDTDGELNVQDRDDMGSGHGWAGANQVFWNCKATSSICQSPWVSAKNYNIGFQGKKEAGARAGRPDGVWVGLNRPGLFPSSLYEAQYDDRMKNASVFSVMPNLEQLEYSSYKLSFNQVVNPSDIVPGNFSIGGTAGISAAFTVTIIDAFSVQISFAELGILPGPSTLIVTVENIHNTDGLLINGLNSATFSIPDERPVVSGPGLKVTNEDGSFVVAQSTKPGFVYLIRMGEPHASIADFDKAIAGHNGAKSQIITTNVSVPIYTKGIYGGFYFLYAVDEVGRISDAGSNLVEVQETAKVSVNAIDLQDQFQVKREGAVLFIQPKTIDLNYQLTVYSLSGKKLYQNINSRGDEQVDVSKFAEPFVVLSLKTSANMQIIKIALAHY